MIECYGDEREDRVDASRVWIKNAINRREEMIRLVLQHNPAAEAFSKFNERQGGAITASRVRVAILDTGVNRESALFTTNNRIKEYWPLRQDTGRSTPQLDSHGTHVMSLFHHMAPEADVYVADAFDTWESLAKVSVPPV